jgi:trigger factor
VKVSVKDVSGCTKEVQIEVPADDVQTKVDGIYSRISREAKLAGFRKGKAPLDVIKKQYKSAVREEVVHHELPEFFRTALIDQKIDPVAQPQITHLQFEEGSPLKVIATVEIKPEFKLKDYKGLKIKKEKTSVDEEEVDKALENLREQMAQFVPVEDRPAKQDDLVVIDFEGKIGGKAFDGGKASRYPVLLGTNNLLKDFEANLIGIAKGGTKTFKMTFPQDYGKKEVAGQEAEFTVTLYEIKEKKLPMVDNEFAKDVGKSETVKELREKLESQIKTGKENEQRSKMIEQIGEKLIASHPFDVPVSLVNMEQQRLVKQGVERLKNQGIDANKLSQDQQKEFVEKLRPVAQKNVQMALIVEKISAAENIQCEEKDMEAYYDKVSKNVNQPADMVKRYLQQQGNTESVKEWIQYEKALDYLIAQAKIEAA